MAEWQPIETAPKDGRWFLGGRHGVETDRMRYLDYKAAWVDSHHLQRDPTHWMPLPEPPKKVSDA